MTHLRTSLAVALLAASALVGGLPAAARAADLLITQDRGLDAAQRAQIRSAAGVTFKRSLSLPGAEVVSVPPQREARALVALNADKRVRAAAPDVPVHAAGDPYFGLQWSLENGGNYGFIQQPAPQADADIDAGAAWDSGADGTGVTVAVVDTAIDTALPDLSGRIDSAVTAPDFVVGGCATYDVPTPDHGTAVAGVIAADHNDVGIAGIAAGATILPVRALDNCGGGSLQSVLPALDFAAAHASIVVAAFGTSPGLSATQQAQVEAQVDNVLNAHPGTLFVVPAGNEANDDDAHPVYPCSAPAGNLICVGMTDANDGPDCLGNVGAKSVDLFAPGQDIESVVRLSAAASGVMRFTGTSMAAPIVAGVAALVESTWTHDPGQPLDPADTTALADSLRRRPTDTLPGVVDARSALAPLSVSGGRVNAAKALGVATTDDLPVQPPDWQPCDDDHDGFRNSIDHCPDTPGTDHGCPVDADSDGVPDASDNCPSVANPGQENADHDGLGDACDPDIDGDGVPNAADGCPYQANATATGCPYVPPPSSPPPPAAPTTTPVVVQPVVAPRIVSVRVTVARSRRSARVTVRLSRTLPAAVTVERRVRRRKHLVWQRVLRRSLTFTAAGRSMTVRTRVRGRYRVTVGVSGARTVRRIFRV